MQKNRTSFSYADATAYGPALAILQKIVRCVDWLLDFVLLPAVFLNPGRTRVPV